MEVGALHKWFSGQNDRVSSSMIVSELSPPVRLDLFESCGILVRQEEEEEEYVASFQPRIVQWILWKEIVKWLLFSNPTRPWPAISTKWLANPNWSSYECLVLLFFVKSRFVCSLNGLIDDRRPSSRVLADCWV